jgi:RHS repeat-associated protein
MKTKTTRKLPLVLLLFGACRSLSHDGGGAGKDGVSAKGPLTASTTPAEALSGRIRVPSTMPDFTSSVSTVGEAAVGHDGSASYRVPLWVPDGVAGLQPSLAIEYNSESGIGLLGPRWRLTGLSVITRCPKTLAQDGVQRPVDFFGDTFCLDGQRMVILSNGAVSEFRTERESYTKILGTKDLNGDYVTFKAYRRDGRILHYGRTRASRLHGNPMQFNPSGTTTRDVTYAYYVDKIEDRYTNSILITYANAVATATTGISQVQELEPAKIAWGSTDETLGQRSVTFDYDQSSIPDGSTVDTNHTRWVRGLGIGAAQYLTAINVFGPDGLGGTPLLKQYTFTYSDNPATRTGTPLITGDRVLSAITEGDPDNRAWKKTTTIQWEAGSFAYTRTPFNASDVALSNYQGPPTQTGGAQTQYAAQYRRITVADLNGDGRDDLVYRGYSSPHHNGFYDCLGWNVRTSEFAPGNTSGIPYLSTATPLTALGSDPDTSCRAYLISSGEYQNAKAPNAYAGDIMFADLNGDNRLDIVSPIGKGGYDAGANNQYSYLAGYRVYLGTSSSGTPMFGNPINFLDSVGQPPSIGTFSAPKDATIAIGDVWGDGLPIVITRGPSNPRFHGARFDGSGLVAKTESRGGQQFPYSECPLAAACEVSVPDAQFPDGKPATEHIAAIDLDGDGTAELVRNALSCLSGWDCGAMNGVAWVQSPTMSGPMPLPHSDRVIVPWPAFENRWFLDLNGDGLTDVVWGASSLNIYAAINTGAGFGPSVETQFPRPVSSDEFFRLPTGDLLVADFNLDGRQDLISTRDATMTVLLSDGAGRFSLLDTTIPPGVTDKYARHNVAADLNGDGLPDILNLEGNPASAVVGHIRQGQAPTMVTKVTEGTGRTIEFSYDVVSGKDGAFYAANRSLACDKAPQYLECLNRGRWLVKSLKLGGTDIAAPTTQTFTYRGGVTDKRGRGFLGFIQRDIYGPGSRHETITYDPISRVEKTGMVPLKPYAYPFALLPSTDRVDVNTDQGPNRHHYETLQNFWAGSWQSNGTYAPLPFQVDYRHYDCPTVSGSTCSGPSRTLLKRSQFLTFDPYGNLTKMETGHYDATGGPIRIDTDVINYQAADTTNWLVSLLDPARPSTRASSILSPPETVTRTIRFTPDLTHGGVFAVAIEPSGDRTTHLLRTFERDPRGRLTSVTEEEVGTGLERATYFFYTNIGGTYDPDAVYATAIRRNVGLIVHRSQIWRHPGYGFVVEVDDPNGLAATRSYDTFGRLVSETEMSGASTTVEYSDNPYNGVDVRILPEDKATRMILVHLDSLGRETSRISPVDSARVLKEELAYDAFGRVQNRTIKSGPPSAPTTVLNSYSYGYDDLGRLLADCHLASDNMTYCKTSAFDGRSVTTWDEAGRTVTQIADALGRPSIQRAAVPTTSDATFTYGPFDVLKREKTSDGSGQTDMAYDVLGRQISLTRTGTGTRRTTYNAFGEVVETSKQKTDGSQIEKLVYGRDGLGRVKSITDAASAASYAVFSWDAPASSPGSPAPNAIGKLVDVTAAAQIHYDYGANGLPSKKSWTVASFAAPTAFGSMQFAFDSQGRLSTLTYPTPGWSSPLTLKYSYDQYNGEESSVVDDANPATPIWSVSGRNQLGQIATESMKVSTGTTITRVTNYYLQNGLTKNATLAGSNGQSQLSYTYEEDNLPATLGMSGVGGTWTSELGHDNLGRMTRWRGIAGGPLVTYSYDGDGNLTQRSWSGETVTYGTTSTARTVATSRGGVTVANEAYQMDTWGRIVDTPAATFTYDSLDRVDGVTEKATGRYAFFRLDGFGNRVLTVRGNPFDGQGHSLLYALDGLYEFRDSSSTGTEERCRVRAGGRLIGELVRTWNTPERTATFYLTDNVGSVVAEASSSGTVTARSRRDPFGNLMTNAATPYLPADPTASDPDGSGRMGFGDHPREANWGLVDMVSRFYSSRLGRFISPDKILPDAFDRTQHNAFAYVGNAPAVLTDPLGYCDSTRDADCRDTPPVIVVVPPPLPKKSKPGGWRGDGSNGTPCVPGGACGQSSEGRPVPSGGPPPKTDINRLNGAATVSAASPNVARTTGVNRSQAQYAGYDINTPLSMSEQNEVATWIGRNSHLIGGEMMDRFREFRNGQREAHWNAGNYGFWFFNYAVSGLFEGRFNGIAGLKGARMSPAAPLRNPGLNNQKAPANGTFYVDTNGNVVRTPPGGSITSSPDGKWIQARDAAGNPTGVRIDGPHKPMSHPDPRAQVPHGHVPGVTNPDGTPWLPIK